MSPFTFTKDLVKRKNYFKRTAYIMQARPTAACSTTCDRNTELSGVATGSGRAINLRSAVGFSDS